MSGEERDRWERVKSWLAGRRCRRGEDCVSKELTARYEKQWIRGKGGYIETKEKVWNRTPYAGKCKAKI